jgi:AraC family transcriptional regulator, regulatory protein of adaptative response / DNA-3-methyladenine glycosylase II
MPYADLRQTLLALPGIGPWTAELMAIRLFGHPDVFPSGDLILQRALDLHPGLDLQALSPWRAYAALYLWREYAKSLSKSNKRGQTI